MQIEEGRAWFQLILNTVLTNEQESRIFELSGVEEVFRGVFGRDCQSSYVVFGLDSFADFTTERVEQAKADVKEML